MSETTTPFTPEMIERLRREIDTMPDPDRVTELAAEARAALRPIAPPHDPATENPLYYPLLFLVEAVEAERRWMEQTDAPVPVHNHGTEDGPGLACRERIVDGRRVGECVAEERGLLTCPDCYPRLCGCALSSPSPEPDTHG